MPPDTTEDRILNSIPDFADNDASVTNETTEDTTQTNAPTDANDTSSTEPSNVSSPRDTGNREPAPTAKDAAVITRRDGLVEKPSATDPRARDLVNPQTGEVVARGGIERRVFEAAQKTARDNASLVTRVKGLEEQITKQEGIARIARELGVLPQDQEAAIRLMADFYKDPLKTLEVLVAEVKAKGYDITPLLGPNSGIDTQAVKRMLETTMAPITNATQQQAQMERLRNEAKTTLDTFLDNYSDAEHNLDTLAKMIAAEPGLTLEKAYYQLTTWAYQKGYDPTQPLVPQIEAQRARQPNNQPAAPVTQPTPTQQPRAPLPMGMRSDAPIATPMSEATKFNEDASWADIIKHSMRQNGYAV